MLLLFTQGTGNKGALSTPPLSKFRATEVKTSEKCDLSHVTLFSVGHRSQVTEGTLSIEPLSKFRATEVNNSPSCDLSHVILFSVGHRSQVTLF